MNKTRAQAREFAVAVKASPVAQTRAVRPFVIPPFPYIADVTELLQGSVVRTGAQNMHWDDAGAWTGEVSPGMVRDCGATLVELGHSERREHFNETDETVALKVQAALRHDLLALVCVGDTKVAYDAGQTASVLEVQVRGALALAGKVARGKVIFAYEPVWSIGVGGIPADPDFANEQHKGIKAVTAAITGEALPVVYGGSVSLLNCLALIERTHVDGLFIGRAAWDAAGYIGIVEAVTARLGAAT